MKVRALISFASVLGGSITTYVQGQVFELPAGAEAWPSAGLVEVLEATPPPEPAPPAPKRRAPRKAKDDDR